MEPTFDISFSELQAKITAGLRMLVAEFPEAAVRMIEVINGATADAQVQAEFAADEARSNVIRGLITNSGQILAEALPASEPTPEPEPEPAPEG